MSPITLVLIAVGVSADAFAVALTKGLHLRHFRLSQALVIAAVFGVFQAVMPLIGWFLGSQFARYISSFDHWIAFGLLLLIGGKMIWEAVRGQDDHEKDTDRIGMRELLLLGLATSIDALAVGVSFAFVPVSIGGAVALIGAVTFVFALAGVAIGRRVGARFGRPAEIVGGVVLVLVGSRILVDHLGVL
ncbi:putative Mn2+ efflux pump MntP [Frondihabitans sp. PhB188]|uniref:manganese efflux pump MntP n=1 Tax=Frondihabitans sp. PhB188 TaxID=2485200 RepID=UPI000F482B8F|nr:manganese efflux pump MntP family protein [Frondihabitans sp. PhB188]ROQ30285.1 putative Mn2+ efflux pump MntP [Frondihabitans sp. PhB188]